jgi:pimeloyl-ACP methyl ester carboxylesterase
VNGLGAQLATALSAYVVAPDLVGHGKSSHIPGGVYTLPLFQLNIMKFIELIGWHDPTNPFCIVGHSMGQEIACVLASSFPYIMDSIVMIDGCGPWVEDNTARKIFRSGVKEWQKKDQYAASPRSFGSIEELIVSRQNKKFSPAGISRHGAAAIVHRGVTFLDGVFQYSHDPRAGTLGFQGQTEEQVREILCKLPRALCLLAEDGLVDEGGESPKTMLQRRRQIFPDLTVKWMEGGHHIHLDTPGIAATIIVDFIRSGVSGVSRVVPMITDQPKHSEAPAHTNTQHQHPSRL